MSAEEICLCSHPREYHRGGGLCELCRRMGIPLDNAHDALADVRATAELARRLLGSMALPIPWLRVPVSAATLPKPEAP